MISFKECILVFLMSIQFACAEDKPKTPAPTSNASSAADDIGSIDSDESENAVGTTTKVLPADVNGIPVPQGGGGSSNTSPPPAKSCPPFPDIASPINAGGGNCADACVRKLKAAHQYLTSLGSKVVKPKDAALKTAAVARSFYKELTASGKSLGCNPLDGKSYQ